MGDNMTQQEQFLLAHALEEAIQHPNCVTTKETRRAWKRTVECIAGAMFMGASSSDKVAKQRAEFMHATTYRKVQD